MEIASVKPKIKADTLSESEVAHNREMLDKWLSGEGSHLGDASPVVNTLQKEAAKRFLAVGLPGKRAEEYKYTNIRAYLNEEFTTGNNTVSFDKKNLEPFLISNEFVSIVVVNGRYLPEYSQVEKLPKEVAVRSLFTALEEGNEIAIKHFNAELGRTSNPLGILNTALASDGIFISVPENFSCPVPIHIINVSVGEGKKLYNPRNFVYIGKEAELTLIESHHSVSKSEKVFTNSVSEFVIESNAKLENYVLQDEQSTFCRNDIRQFAVNKDSLTNNVLITFNGSMVRNDTNVYINGEHAEVHLNGLFVVKENNHTDNHTMMEHRVPNCFSNELYKGIISDNATGVFNGKILVYHDAQKTNAYQSNKNILMGDKATINTKPQLEIYADDVRCTHGTSTGRLNDEALFYMRSRGLNEKLAKNILLQSFAKEVSNTIKNESFRTFIEQKIEENIQ